MLAVPVPPPCLPLTEVPGIHREEDSNCQGSPPVPTALICQRRAYYCMGSECRRHFPLGTLENYEPVALLPEAFPFVPTMEQTLGLLRDSLAPRRFEDLQSLAGAVKSCYGKNSFRIFDKLLQQAVSSPPVGQLESIFSASRGDGDAQTPSP